MTNHRTRNIPYNTRPLSWLYTFSLSLNMSHSCPPSNQTRALPYLSSTRTTNIVRRFFHRGKCRRTMNKGLKIKQHRRGERSEGGGYRIAFCQPMCDSHGPTTNVWNLHSKIRIHADTPRTSPVRVTARHSQQPYFHFIFLRNAIFSYQFGKKENKNGVLSVK